MLEDWFILGVGCVEAWCWKHHRLQETCRWADRGDSQDHQRKCNSCLWRCCFQWGLRQSPFCKIGCQHKAIFYDSWLVCECPYPTFLWARAWLVFRFPLPATGFSGATPYQVKLGPIGREEATQLNKEIESFIPLFVKLIEDGKVVPNDYEVVGEPGFESVIEAYEYQKAGKGGSNKVLVKLQEA